VKHTTRRADALINALNDRSRTTIGNPWKGTYHVTIDVTNHGDSNQLLSELQALGVNSQVNVGYIDRIAIYDPDGLKRLLALGDSLDEWTLKRLTTLVRARGPVSEPIVSRIRLYRAMNWGYERIAERMNECQVATGMGGKGWTAAKVKDAAEGRTPKRLRSREAA
jgi:hypothetical protein